MTTEQSIERLQKLKGIAERVRTHLRDVGAAEKLAMNYHDELLRTGQLYEKSQEELRLAILLCGKALLEAKELLPYGEWGAWLAREGFARRTAHRYIAMARPVVPTLAQVTKGGGLTARVFMRVADGWAKWLGKRLPDATALATWLPEERLSAAERLRPAAELYEALRGTPPTPGQGISLAAPNPAG